MGDVVQRSASSIFEWIVGPPEAAEVSAVRGRLRGLPDGRLLDVGRTAGVVVNDPARRPER